MSETGRVSSEEADRLMERLDAAYMECPEADEPLARLLMDALLWVRKTAPASTPSASAPQERSS